jgi:hypothetical protein
MKQMSQMKENIDRKGFLKALGLGMLGATVASVPNLDQVFTPDLQSEIDALKAKLTQRINFNFSAERIKYETTVVKQEITQQEIFGWNYDNALSGTQFAMSYVEKWFFNQRHRKKEVDDKFRVQLAINVFDRAKELAYMGAPSDIDLYTLYTGACYLLLEQYDIAQNEFEKISAKGPQLYVVEYYNGRNIPFPSNFKFNSSNKLIIDTMWESELFKEESKKKRQSTINLTLNTNV